MLHVEDIIAGDVVEVWAFPTVAPQWKRDARYTIYDGDLKKASVFNNWVKIQVRVVCVDVGTTQLVVGAPPDCDGWHLGFLHGYGSLATRYRSGASISVTYQDATLVSWLDVRSIIRIVSGQAPTPQPSKVATDESFLRKHGWYSRSATSDVYEWSHDHLTNPRRWVLVGKAVEIQIRILAGTGTWKTG
jgi:hypothetical protein